jgi:pimeloyl-ACP methyl ester carboxylesterase
MVLLHGLFGQSRNWQTIARRLAPDYRVITADLRNHGDSPWAACMTYAEMADDLEALFAAKGVERAIIVGHSVGGKTAMTLALRHSALVEALIVVDIAPVTYDHSFLSYIEAMAAIDLAAVRRRADVEAALAPAVTDPDERAFLLQNLKAGEDGYSWAIALPAIAANMAALMSFPDIGEVEYEGRALFISGERSDYIGQRYHRQIYRLFPQSEFAVIPDAGHRVHAEQPDRFLACITNFLDSAYA